MAEWHKTEFAEHESGAYCPQGAYFLLHAQDNNSLVRSDWFLRSKIYKWMNSAFTTSTAH